MSNCKWVLLAILFLLLFPHAIWAAEDRPPSEVYCEEDNSACQLLQMAEKGTFARCDAQDSLNVRILAAVYPRLCAITQQDLIHYAEEFQVEETAIRISWYQALENCLWADILLQRSESSRIVEADQVLMLFLEEDESKEQPEVRKQILAIQEEMTDAMLHFFTEYTQAPELFIHWLFLENI